MVDQPEENETSLEGKGWDILVGGRDNLQALGGDDPFDDGPTPDDLELQSVMEVGIEANPASSEGTMPRELSPDDLMFGLPADVVLEGDDIPSRDISPEELEAGVPGIISGTETPTEPVSPEVVDEFNRAIDEGETVAMPINVDALPMPSLTPVGEPNEDGVIVLPPLGSTLPPVSPPDDIDMDELLTAPSGSMQDGDVVPLPPPPLQRQDTGGIIEPATGEPARPPIGSSTAEVTPRSDSQFEGESVFIGGDIDGSPAPSTSSGRPITRTPRSFRPELSTRSRSVYDPFEDAQRILRQRALPDEDLPTDPMLEDYFITEERVEELWVEINRVADFVVNDVRGNFEVTQNMLTDLKQARELLMAGRQNYDNAELIVNEVKARLRLERKVRSWTQTRATWLGVYLVAWFFLLSASTLFTQQVETLLLEIVYDWMAATIVPAILGAFGAVLGALWILIKHVAVRRDFDPIHTPWYLTMPLLGGALGVVTYYILTFTGFIATAVQGTPTLNFTTPIALLYPVYIIVGFRPDVVWALVERVLKTIMPENSAQTPSSTEPGEA